MILTVATAPPTAPPKLHPWAAPSVAASFRPAAPAAATFSVRAGVRRDDLVAGLFLGADTARALEGLDQDAGYTSAELGACVGWGPRVGPVHLVLLAEGGAAWRRFDDGEDGLLVQSAFVPVAGLTAMAGVPIGADLRVGPVLRGVADVARVTVGVDGEPRSEVSPARVEAGIVVVYGKR